MPKNKAEPLPTVHLLPVLDDLLIALLESLSPEDWQKPTVAKLWNVKDVAAHLLDGNIRSLSMLRDQYFGEKPEAFDYEGIVNFLNGLNADWVRAMKRVSPNMLILLHKITGKLYCEFCLKQDISAKAGFSVAWAGEEESTNLMHLAREYTEKWHHQQQIREAVNKPGIMTYELFYPFIDTFMFGMPHALRHYHAKAGTTLQVIVKTEIGGNWLLSRSDEGWILSREKADNPHSTLMIPPHTAWKLFSKSLRPEQVMEEVSWSGDRRLVEAALQMVSVMA